MLLLYYITNVLTAFHLLIYQLIYLKDMKVFFSNLLLIGSETPWYCSAAAPGQQDKNRSHTNADSSGSPDQ